MVFLCFVQHEDGGNGQQETRGSKLQGAKPSGQQGGGGNEQQQTTGSGQQGGGRNRPQGATAENKSPVTSSSERKVKLQH